MNVAKTGELENSHPRSGTILAYNVTFYNQNNSPYFLTSHHITLQKLQIGLHILPECANNYANDS